MLGKLVKSTYKYADDTVAVLSESGARVNAREVSCSEDKVVSVPNADVEVNGKNFNFSIYGYGANGQKTYNLNSVPEDIDGQAIVREFVAFVENDIIS